MTDQQQIDRLNERFQEMLYELIDSKANGLRDCHVSEIIDVTAAAIAEVFPQGVAQQ